MINPIRETIILSLLPVSELRGAIPFAVYKGISIYHAFIIAIIANFFVIPFVFFFLDHLHEYFMQYNYYRVVFNKYIEKKRCVLERHIGSKWEFFALVSFVGIPLPITGAYTGTLLAWFFEIPRRKAYIALSLGILISGIIVSLTVFFGIRTLEIFLNYT